MIKTPLLSVIIPSYNRANTLKGSIESVLKQTENISSEIIVVDDASRDETKEALRAFNSKIKFIELEKHTGRPAIVRNHGLKVAQGKFIAFQDADDVWVNRNLSEEIKFLDEQKVSLVYGNAKYVDQDLKPHSMGALVRSDQVLNGYAVTRLASKWHTPIPTPTVITRRSDLIKVGGFNESLEIGEDTDLWLRLASLGNFVFQNQVKALIRRDGQNLSSTPEEEGDKALLRHEIARIDMFNQLKNNKSLKKTEKQVLEYRIYEIKLMVAEIFKRLGKQSTVEVDEASPPIKPKQLIKVDQYYEQKLTQKVDKVLKMSLSRWPVLYNLSKNLLKKIAKPFRR